MRAMCEHVRVCVCVCVCPSVRVCMCVCVCARADENKGDGRDVEYAGARALPRVLVHQHICR